MERENAKLKRLVAELSLEKQILKDVAGGNFDLMEFLYQASERFYSTTSDGRGFANGGSQGAEGDRRAAIRGANAAGAGGL